MIGVTWGHHSWGWYIRRVQAPAIRARRRQREEHFRRTGRHLPGTAGFIHRALGGTGIGALFNPILHQVLWIGRAIELVARPVLRVATSVAGAVFAPEGKVDLLRVALAVGAAVQWYYWVTYAGPMIDVVETTAVVAARHAEYTLGGAIDAATGGAFSRSGLILFGF